VAIVAVNVVIAVVNAANAIDSTLILPNTGSRVSLLPVFICRIGIDRGVLPHILAANTYVMADNLPPNLPPSGALPPKKETGKVQPKKETVRINLPPKPTAAPTIKLPTLPPGGPTGAASKIPSRQPDLVGAPTTKLAGATSEAKQALSIGGQDAVNAPTSKLAGATSEVKGASPQRATAAPVAQRGGTAPAPRAAAPVRTGSPTIGTLDKVLIYAAAVLALAAAGTTGWMWWMLKDTVDSFTN